MPADASERLLHYRSLSSSPNHRYKPLPPLYEAPDQKRVTTEIKLFSGATQVHLIPRSPQNIRPVRSKFISRPCMKFHEESSNSGKYSKLNLHSHKRPNTRGRGIFNNVAGRGYENLNYCGDLNSGGLGSRGSSVESTPKCSPSVSPKCTKPGILTSSAISKSGIKRLSRVSFGSSKGSMVETLIYDSPLTEEDKILEEDTTILDPVAQKFGTETGEVQRPASKVKVTFFECEKPLAVTSPETSELTPILYDFGMTSQTGDAVLPNFDRQLSSESGHDNPFRPDGDISKEADEIVQMIKSGVPLDARPKDGANNSDCLAHESNTVDGSQNAGQLNSSSGNLASNDSCKKGANGATPSPGTVELKHDTVMASEAAQVEHVVLKKKKQRCCVIQ